ncbi:MAG: GTP 3',8-cyclase MoaA [Candidatus Eisenbacteria bacterium]|nr:GTP 3',8-cyclase MoaA [Candidatus Eisenbacteria bacterium]
MSYSNSDTTSNAGLSGARGLRDARGRRITYLRVSLTDRCNFRCLYCMPPEGIRKMDHAEFLPLEGLAETVRVFVEDLGIEKVRVTGGEPLVRRGAIAFLERVGTIARLRDFALTTNGYFLDDTAAAIRAAGVKRLNVSLDTLQPERFARMTGVDGLERVLAGLEAARQAGFESLKLNAVMMRENIDEAGAILRFGMERGIEVRFIELMPSHHDVVDQFIPAAEIRARLSREFTLEAEGCGGPGEGAGCAAKRYRVLTGVSAGYRCGFIAPITEPFCLDCNRVRLRGDGRLLPCLSAEQWIDLKPFVLPSLQREALAVFVRRELGASKAGIPHARRIQSMWRIGG